MIFKRRNPKPLLRTVGEFFWPRGGWRRATTYVLHRMRRLPDTPERIALGIAVGSFVSFLPLYGLHFASAALLAWIFRGNILAALLGTFYGNPITFPFMAVSALELGHWLLGSGQRISFSAAMLAIGHASGEITHNLMAIVTTDTAHWYLLADFFWQIFLPYMIGGTIIGLPSALAIYFLHLPLVRAYQRGRTKRLKQRFEAARRRQLSQEAGDET
ncbi:DUF2062 domain-containing protein [Pararhodobacter sp.]|uniref:DUF2062 domain-containing protein n=1 Tax=Pararhodobacter sp. TaxID=2127056 RepID=UPI002AFF345E|nr:DUF2062 domain-containing protein [Pararhodobacter sp.]